MVVMRLGSRMGARAARWLGLAALLAGGGCYSGLDGEAATLGGGADGADGGDGDGDGDGDDDDDDDDDSQAGCEGPNPGSSPIRRLTGWEYDNTVAALLGDTTRPSQTQGFPQEGGSGFDNNADVGTVTWLMANKYMLAAEDVADRAVQDLTGLLPCDPAANETACLDQFIDEFGSQAWRRPLDATERAQMQALFADTRADYPLEEAVSLLLQAFLQSPNFLYRVELGVGEEQGTAAIALSDYEMASRLSYFLWGTMPDDALLAAAAAGELSTPEEVEAQARRMLDDDRAREMVAHFSEQWLGYHGLAVASKDPDLFPEWTTGIADKQVAETNAFVDHVMFEDDATLATMLTAPYTFVDAELAAYYGIDAPAGAGMVQVTPEDQETAGILSQGSILTVFAKPNQTNPISRGLFVREHLLCQIPPPPPDDVDINPPQPDPDATTREQYDQHRSDPACAGCHVLFDPVGFGFENFDAIGRWRETENGKPIDASGELAATDVNGEFYGVAELGERLGQSEMVADCVARQWFRFANGRTESDDNDQCSLDQIRGSFEESGYDLRELLVSLTQADSFMYRTAYAAEGGQ